MASKKKPVKQHFEKSYLALKSLSLQLNTYLIEEVFKGIAVEKLLAHLLGTSQNSSVAS